MHWWKWEGVIILHTHISGLCNTQYTRRPLVTHLCCVSIVHNSVREQVSCSRWGLRSMLSNFCSKTFAFHKGGREQKAHSNSVRPVIGRSVSSHRTGFYALLLLWQPGAACASPPVNSPASRSTSEHPEKSQNNKHVWAVTSGGSAAQWDLEFLLNPSCHNSVMTAERRKP